MWALFINWMLMAEMFIHACIARPLFKNAVSWKQLTP